MSVALLLASVCLLVPIAVLAVECLAACLPGGRAGPLASGPRPRAAVLIPARDEEASVAAAVGSLLPQLQPRDRLLVIADNCADATAEVARRAGAEVVERRDADRVGKGYALAAGLRALEADPPAVVVFVDADCVARGGAVDALVRRADHSGRPVQAAYVMEAPTPSDPGRALSALAVLVKNRVRPAGLARLGLPCLLAGSGMALPWKTVVAVPPPGASAVEDLDWSIDLAVAGAPPCFCAEALVTSPLPAGGADALAQRRRWEGGHLRALLTRAPALLALGIRRGRPSLVAMALDIAVPPLSLLAVAWFALAGAAAARGALGGSWSAAGALLAGAGLLALSLAAAWVAFARATAPIGTLARVPLYVLGKVPMYLSLPLRGAGTWSSARRAPRPLDGIRRAAP